MKTECVTSHEYSDQSVHIYQTLVYSIATACIAYVSGQDVYAPYVSDYKIP
jgi:transaldolase